MGANTYLESVTSKGYKTESPATPIQQNIDPRSGNRIAIRAFGFTCGATVTSVYFMQAFGQSTMASAVASGLLVGDFALAAEPDATITLGMDDLICIELDNGKFQYTTAASGTWSAFSIGDALEDDVAAGNRVWQFGVHSDVGHLRLVLTASVQTAKEIDGGIFYADNKNAPMIVYHANDAAASGSNDYVTIDYINV